jgi:hypothetical protein
LRSLGNGSSRCNPNVHRFFDLRTIRVVTTVRDCRSIRFFSREIQKVPNLNNFFMCGRCRLSWRKQVVEEYFYTDPGEQRPDSPKQHRPYLGCPRSSGKIRRNLSENRRFFAGGLIPSWAKTRLLPRKMINARSETGCTKSAFRDALKSRRC